MAKGVDVTKYPTWRKPKQVKGCKRKIEVCKEGRDCLLPEGDKWVVKVAAHTFYIIRNCKEIRAESKKVGMRVYQPCIFTSDLLANTYLAEKCGTKSRRVGGPCKSQSCSRPPRPRGMKKRG